MTPASGAAGRVERRHLLSLAAALTVGVALRIVLAFAAQGKHWSDSATLALMAMHEMRGHFYTFYWGQDYMGSIESLAMVPLFAVLGVSDVTLSMGLLPWYLMFGVALFFLVARCGGPLAASISVWLLAFAPPYVQYQQVMPRGDYPEILAFGTLLLCLTLAITHDGLSRRREQAHLLSIGFIAGVAFWTNWLVFPYFAIVGLYLLLHDWRLPFRPVMAGMLACFFLGSLPFWVHNLRNGFPTFAFVDDVQDPEGQRVAFQYAILGALPELLGFRNLNEKFVLGWLGALLTVVAALALAGLVIGLRKSWWALLRGRLRETSPLLALLLLLAATVEIYSVGLPGRFHVPRYLLPATTATFGLLALGVAWLSERSRAAAGAVLAALLALYGAQLVEFRSGLAASPRPGVEGPVDRLADELVKSGIRYGYADYGDSTITTYLTRERVVLTNYGGERYPLDEFDFHDPAIILRQSSGPAEGTLHSLNATFSVKKIPGYQIYWPIRYDGIARAPLPRRGWSVAATIGAADAPLMLDDDRWTYWSVPADGSHPTVTLDLGATQAVTGVYFELGQRPYDAFNKLRLEASTDGEHWSLVEDAEWDFPVQFEPSGQATTVQSGGQYVLFPPRTARALRFTRLASTTTYNWSIGEIAVFGPGDAHTPFRLPEFPDPRSTPLAERRLRLQTERETENDRPLVELRRLYRSLGESAKLADVERLEAERFTPQVPLGWRFGPLKLVGFDWRALGRRRLEITYYWQAMRRIGSSYAAYVRFHGPGGNFKDEAVLEAPLGDAFWHTEEIVKHRRVIAVPTDVADGEYAARIGMWAPTSGHHVWLGPFGLLGPGTRRFFRLEVRAGEVAVQATSS